MLSKYQALPSHGPRIFRGICVECVRFHVELLFAWTYIILLFSPTRCRCFPSFFIWHLKHHYYLQNLCLLFCCFCCSRCLRGIPILSPNITTDTAILMEHPMVGWLYSQQKINKNSFIYTSNKLPNNLWKWDSTWGIATWGNGVEQIGSALKLIHSKILSFV